MILTIGMASYKNYSDVWFTVQALRMYHDLTDCEILIIDNFGDIGLENWCKGQVPYNVRYEKFTEPRGTAAPRQRVFEQAKGDFVICIDSHVLLKSRAIDKMKQWILANPGCSHLIHGLMLYDDFQTHVDQMKPEWACHMWGVWGPALTEIPTKPYEIPMHGMGIFGAFKNQWLGFNPEFRGFGGEEGYIHEKYHKAGRKVLCLPWLTWMHKFHCQMSPTLYPNILEERIRNYYAGFREIGLDTEPIRQHFGDALIKKAGIKL